LKIELLEQCPPQEVDFSNHKHLELLTHKQAETSTWQHLHLLGLHSTIVCFEHGIRDTSNILPRHLHQQRRGSDLVNSGAREVVLYSFETVLYRQQDVAMRGGYMPSDCHFVLPPNLLSPRREEGMAFRMW